MANYSLIINSRFNPFSYQEMLAPVLMATQAHQELENQYGELSTKANIWEEMANEQTDPYAYKMYKTYANDLEEKAGQLAREGLNAASRRDMLNMRARYSKEITPIETAYKRREELAAEQRKASLSNPTMFYQRNASTMSLDDFIKNPSIDYGERYSGALLAQQVGQMATNLKTALTGKSKLKGIGLPYQYEQLLQYGYTPEQIQQAITNPQEGNPVLNTIVEQALAASGMKSWASPEQLAQARAYANQGLYNAIGKTEFKNFTDSFSMQDALARRAEARKAAEEAKAKANTLPKIEKGLPIDIHNLNNASYDEGVRSKLYNLLYELGVSNGGVNGRRIRSREETRQTRSDLFGAGTRTIKTKDGTDRVKWFNSKGELLSRQAVLSQIDDNQKAYDAIANKYDKIWQELKQIGLKSSNGKTYTVKDIQRAVLGNLNADSNASHTMSVVSLRLSDPSNTLSNKIVPLLLSSDGKKLNMKEVETFNNDGTLKFSKNSVDVSDIMDDDKPNGTPYFFAPPSQRGVLMRLNGKMYFIDAKNLGSIGATSNSIDIPRLKEAVTARNELIKEYGEEAYYSSETGREIEDVISSSGQSYLKAYIQQLDSEVETPKSKVTD